MALSSLTINTRLTDFLRLLVFRPRKMVSTFYQIVQKFFLLLCLSSILHSEGAIYSQQVFSYDCSGKSDGFYTHPGKCTHFVACVGGTQAYEMSCPLNYDGNLLHFKVIQGPYSSTGRCDFPEVADCAHKKSTQIPILSPPNKEYYYYH
ncbi:unnamed protein product [Allacma fusca]|uniref:Chitin-binding type-2 domain-containing protein n=1 Tax=Allacma fusca TaxID=39272 RepID=A0A8J2NZ56_9HEXA|nr:unnamed protein product [Allacma fusca]